MLGVVKISPPCFISCPVFWRIVDEFSFHRTDDWNFFFVFHDVFFCLECDGTWEAHPPSPTSCGSSTTPGFSSFYHMLLSLALLLACSYFALCYWIFFCCLTVLRATFSLVRTLRQLLTVCRAQISCWRRIYNIAGLITMWISSVRCHEVVISWLLLICIAA